MKSAVRFVAIVGAITLTLPVLAGGSPRDGVQSRGAERTVLEALYDLSDSFYSFQCSDDGELVPETDGELIEIEGHIYERITALYDGSEGLHYTINTMPVGLRGVGQTSGEEFRIQESDITIARQRLTGLAGSYREQLKLVGRDTHRTYSFVSRGHYVIGADGTVKVTRDELRADCRP